MTESQSQKSEVQTAHLTVAVPSEDLPPATAKSEERTSRNVSVSLHNPQRGEHESRDEYKARRKLSNQIGRGMLTIGNGGVSSREQYRDSMRASGTMGKRVRAYKALMNAWADKRVVKFARHSDEHGAYTLVGKSGRMDYPSPRRKWLAGISAQRGY